MTSYLIFKKVPMGTGDYGSTSKVVAMLGSKHAALAEGERLHQAEPRATFSVMSDPARGVGKQVAAFGPPAWMTQCN